MAVTGWRPPTTPCAGTLLDAETFAKAAEDRTEAGTHIPPGSFRGIGR